MPMNIHGAHTTGVVGVSVGSDLTYIHVTHVSLGNVGTGLWLNSKISTQLVVKGKLGNLQSTVDTCLNGPANNRMCFKVLSPYVLTTYTRVNKAYSAIDVDRNKGFISEIDIITWIMVGSMKEVDGKLKLDHVY